MLSSDDLAGLRGATIAVAEIRELPGGGQYLRLRLASGSVLAIKPDGDDLSLADESSVP
jgi:hypothetical protein